MLYWRGRSKTHQNENDDQKNAGAFFCSMRLEFSLRHSVQFYRFSVDSGKRTKTVVWTQIDRCVFDVNENSYF